ncbi:MAG TPA: hypothetical protein VNQ80_18100 [Parapedobacter sp.]|uniref:hypothetical protein n=1 Tax=Parapedobacter sp. TaxID=1958893 RepID=UPI002B670E58|nr:hypothetical protein [Parapedobacter sp.]HWK59261.1 hypothetical protein [Parapedobacter sp.]
MDNSLNKYKVYRYITTNSLPEIALDEIRRSLSIPENFNDVVKIVNDDLERFFETVKVVYNTRLDGFFKKPGSDEEYTREAKKILEDNFDLLNNDFIDQIIVNLLISEEQYFALEDQLELCSSMIMSSYIDYLFLDHAHVVSMATTVQEVEKIIMSAKYAINSVELLKLPRLVPTEHHKEQVKRKLRALLGFSKTRKKDIKRNDLSKIQQSQKKRTNSRQKQKSFEDLFEKPYRDHIDKFMNILCEVTPELINIDGKWIGAKNAARIYVQALERQGIITPNIPERVIHVALGNKFSHLGESFMKKPKKSTKADDEYSDMDERINLLKSEIKAKPD